MSFRERFIGKKKNRLIYTKFSTNFVAESSSVCKIFGGKFFLGESYFLTDPEGLSNFFEKWSRFKNLSKTIINYNFDHFSRKENVKICLFVRNLTEILDEFVMERHILHVILLIS